MSELRNDGGPAFPRTAAQHKYGSGESEFFEPVDGMSLRDYFASKALIGLLSCPDILLGDEEAYATRAYEHADAMLKAREAK